jgi:hypothetical protein
MNQVKEITDLCKEFFFNDYKELLDKRHLKVGMYNISYRQFAVVLFGTYVGFINRRQAIEIIEGYLNEYSTINELRKEVRLLKWRINNGIGCKIN